MKKHLMLIAVVLAALLYFRLNQRSIHYHILAGSLDSRLPLVPGLAAPYLLMIPLFWAIVVYIWLKDEHFPNLALILLFVFGISDLVYLIYPTYMPRPHHAGSLVGFIYGHDRPYNDLPSGHAEMATFTALYFWQKSTRYKLTVLIFALLVAASALLIKQHSIAGLCAGIFLTLVSWFIINPLTRVISSAG